MGGTVEHGVNVLAAALIDACGAQMDAERRQGITAATALSTARSGWDLFILILKRGTEVSPSQGLKPTPGTCTMKPLRRGSCWGTEFSPVPFRR